MNGIADLWAWRNGTRAADYTFHLIDCNHNDTMAMIRGCDLTEQTVRSLAQAYEFRSAPAREIEIMNRIDHARTRARLEAWRW